MGLIEKDEYMVDVPLEIGNYSKTFLASKAQGACGIDTHPNTVQFKERARAARGRTGAVGSCGVGAGVVPCADPVPTKLSSPSLNGIDMHPGPLS